MLSSLVGECNGSGGRQIWKRLFDNCHSTSTRLLKAQGAAFARCRLRKTERVEFQPHII